MKVNGVVIGRIESDDDGRTLCRWWWCTIER